MKKYSKLMAVLLVVAMLLPGMAQAAPVEVNGVEVTRLGGTDRIGTSVLASQAAYDKADAVVLAGFNGEVDALTGTLLAANKKAPLLVTRQFELSDAVKTEIERLGAKTVYILGGETAVGEKAETQLKAMTGITVERVEGANRNATAAEVAKEVKGTSADHVFLAVGRMPVAGDALADALAVGPASAKNNMPVLLTETNRLPAETVAAMKDLGTTKVTIIGGKSAISQEVEDMLSDYTVDRVEGDSREKTAIAIANEYFAEPSNLIVAYGRKSADALVGGYLGAKWNAPILLTNNSGLTAETKAYIEDHVLDTYVLGSTTVVPETAFDQIVEALEGGEVEELMIESVSAINANTLEVKFNTAVDTSKAAFEVKKGTVKVNVSEKTFADDMKSVQLELASKLFEGEYTVNVTGLTEETLTDSVTVTNEKVGTIEMLSETAPIVTTTTATVGYRVLNQYGEDVTKAPIASSIDWNASTGHTAQDDNKGVLTITKTSTGDFKVDDKVVVTGINAATNTVVTGTVKITDAAVADVVTFKEVYHADGKELSGDSTQADFKLLIEAKDQYGNPVKADRVKSDILFTSSNESLVKVNASTAKDDLGKDKDHIGLDIELGVNKLAGGKATITAISKSTGKVSQYELTVKAAAKLDVFSMTAPAEIVAAGDTVKIPFTATDQFGNAITKAKDLKDVVSFSGTYGGDLVIKDDVKGVAYLEYKPATKGTKVIIASFNGKVSQLSLNVVEAANPVTIESLKDVTTTVAKKGTVSIALKDLVIKDEYGRTVDLKGKLTDTTAAAGNLGKYQIVAKDTTDPVGAVKLDPAVINTDAGKIVVEGVTKGTEVVTFTLEEVKEISTGVYKFVEVSTSALKVTFTTVEKSTFASYELGEIGKVYNDVATHSQDVKVYGVTDNGSKVLLPKDDYTVIVDADLLQYDGTENEIKVKTGNITGEDLFNKDGEIKTNVQVIVDAAETPVTLTKEVIISNVAPKAGILEMTEKEVVGFTIDGKNVIMANAASGVVNKTELVKLIEAEDQYGEEIATPAPKITFTNVKDAAGKSVGRTITGNGTTEAEISELVAGDSFIVTFLLDGKTLTANIKVTATESDEEILKGTNNYNGDLNVTLTGTDFTAGAKTIDGNLTIDGDVTGDINLPVGLIITGNLTVNTPSATVNNNGTVNGTITVKDVSNSTWNQNVAHDGKIVFNAERATLNIGNVIVKNLTLNAKDATVTLADEATITEAVEVNAKTTIVSSKPVKAKIAATVVITVKADADEEGSTVIGTGEVVEDIKAEAEYAKILPKNITKSNISITNAMNLKFSEDIPLSTFDGLSVSILNNEEVIATNTVNEAGFYLHANSEPNDKFVKKVIEGRLEGFVDESLTIENNENEYATWKPNGDTTGNFTVRPFIIREKNRKGAWETGDGRIEFDLAWDMQAVTEDQIKSATHIRLTLEKDGKTYEYTEKLNGNE